MRGRIAIFLPSLRGGGAERVMVVLSTALAERELGVDLVLAKAEGPYLSRVNERVRVVDLGRRRVASSLPGLVRYLRSERPEALLSALNHANLIAMLAHRLARVPSRLVVSEHNTLSQSRPRNLRGRLVPALTSLFYPMADNVVTVSKGVAADLVRVTGLDSQKVKVIYNPVVEPTIMTQAEEPLNHPWFAPGEPPVVLGVGRLTDQKDFSTLIHAFARLCKMRQARLIILGEGELRPQLEALVAELGIREDVALPGFAANPFAYMRRAAVFGLSSLWEGLPTVLIEAMACGTPVVSTDCPSGPREILEDGRWGRLVPVGAVDGMVHAMEATLNEAKHPDVVRRAMDFSADRATEGYLRALGIDG